jgi:hypothetical protein
MKHQHVTSILHYHQHLESEDEVYRLVFILAGSLFYGTVTFQRKNYGFKILVVSPLKMKAMPNCTPPFLLLLTHHLLMEVCQPPLVFMGEH